SEPYWQVFEARLFSNILAELALVPAIVGAVLAVIRWRHKPATGRTSEAILLGLGLTASGWLDFSDSLSRVPVLSVVSSRTPLAVQLPFLLWAVVRFGPTGAGIGVLTTSVIGAWAVVHDVGPFGSISPTTTVTAFTLSLIVVATTMLWLSTLISERRQAQHD